MARNSRLFSVTYFLLKLATILSFMLGGILVLCLCAVLLLLGTNLADVLGIPAMLEDMPRNHLLALAAVGLMGALAGTVLMMLVFVLFTRIVETAMTGDPFVDANADRLTKAGWLLLGIYGVGFVTAIAVAVAMPPALRDMMAKEDAQIQFSGADPSPVGILTILLIFVLAQIFRRGAEMRAELEGTV